MKESVITVSDMHINSTMGLCRPGLYKDDGNELTLNVVQKWLFPTWERFLDEALAYTEGTHRNLVLVGDIGDCDLKDRSLQLMSKNNADMLNMACETLEPLVNACDTSFMIRGTEAHTGQSNWLEEAIASNFNMEMDDSRKAYSWWTLRAIFGGVNFDIAHHTSMGGMFHTYANAAMKLAYTTMQEYWDWGDTPPDVVVRAHNHRWADSGTTFDTRAFCLPAWQWKTAYLNRLGKMNVRPHIGSMAFLCDDGEYTFKSFRYRPKRESVWTRDSQMTSI